MRKVITYGTFDMFHDGHYNMLKRAKEYGDWLIVGVTGEAYDIGRGKLSVNDSLADRIESVRSSGFADEIIVEEYLGQKISDIIRYGVDVFVIGDDWKGKFDHLNEYCEVVYISRTEGISSTQIREEKYRHYSIGIIADRCDDNSLVREAAKVSGFAVAAFYSDRSEVRSALEESFKDIKVCDDITEFMQAVDIVFVNTGLDTRAGFMREAIRAGRHVIADPPFCKSEEEEKALLDEGAENGVIVMHNLKAAHTQVFIQLLWMVKSGMIGEVVRLECSASKNDSNIDQYIYELAASALFMMFKLTGTDYKDVRKRRSYDNGVLEMLAFDFDYGTKDAEIVIGNNLRVRNELTIVGTKGTLRVHDNWWRADSFEIERRGTNIVQSYSVNYDGNGFSMLLKSLKRLIEDGRSEYRLITRSDDVAVVRMLEDSF